MEQGDFSYEQRDARVVFAVSALHTLGDTIGDAFGPCGCLIVSTPGRTATTETARKALGASVVDVFEHARLHVPSTVVEDALVVVRASVPDCIVAIGGGSAIGLGKALARETELPLVAVPTTYSGSEMTDIWGVTDRHQKRTGRDRRAAPRLVVYDPQLTYAMPAGITGPSGLNAIAHAVEALYSPARSPISAMFATDGFRRLATSLPLLVREPANPVARWDALCGAHFCGRALDMTTMGLHHKLCHALGGMLNLPHGLTHAVLLPYTTEYNAVAAPEAMVTIASILESDMAPLGLWELNRTLGIDQTLADLGMMSDDIDRVADQAVIDSYPNPVPVTHQGVRHLLERAMVGEPPI